MLSSSQLRPMRPRCQLEHCGFPHTHRVALLSNTPHLPKFSTNSFSSASECRPPHPLPTRRRDQLHVATNCTWRNATRQREVIEEVRFFSRWIRCAFFNRAREALRTRKQIHGMRAECRKVVWVSAGDKLLIHHTFFINPLCTCVG